MDPVRPSNADPVREKLRQRGAAEHVIRDGADGLISRWREFVGQAEQGYPFGLADYRNDLDTRTLIGFVGLADRVRSEDERFRSLLRHSDRAVWSSDAADAFWVYGYPANAAGELLDDLRREGLA
ncbi:MAG TPA: hypothetical protein VHB50_21010 [Bryobacteraceae bacterium]|nr:hypothetical protein [Bryobacteraceae bacterium]